MKAQSGLEIKKIFRSPCGDQPEKYSHQMQIFSLTFSMMKEKHDKMKCSF